MLEEEFQTWNGLTKDPTETIIMIDSTVDKSGSVCLNLLLAGQHEFKLFCPKDYPRYNSGCTFNVDTGNDHFFWKKSLNEFFRDSKRKLLLTDVLDKALSLHVTLPAKPIIIDLTLDQTEGDEDEDETTTAEDETTADEDFSLLDDDSYFTTEWELQVTKLRKNWATKETEIREAMKKQPSSLNASPIHNSLITMPSSSKAPHLTPGKCDSQGTRQIFSTRAASGVLANDLISILESKELKFSADPIKDNIYKWHAKLFDFKEDSDIAADLKEINLKFGYNYIELQLEFTIGLYPFYPPLVKVIRPKLQDSMMQRVTNLDMLKLSYWNPTKDMKTVLMEIWDYLEKWARVDVDSARNDPQVYWEGAYTDLEHDLVKLALVSEINPRANQEFLSMMNSKPVHYRPNQQVPRNQGRGNEYWQKGIGYGHNNRPGWDINAFIAAQKEKDKQIVVVLNNIVVQLRNICSNQLLLESEMSDDQDMKEMVSLTYLYAIIEGSALLTFMEASLKDVSLLEICRHTSLYKVILDIIKEIALKPKLVGLLGNLPNQHKSISQHLSVLENSASGVLQHVDKIGNGSIPKDQDSKRMKVEQGSKPSLLMMAISCGMVDSEEMKEKSEEELLMENYNTTVAGETLARQFLCVSHLVRTKLQDAITIAVKDDSPSSADAESTQDSMENVLTSDSSPCCNGACGDASTSSDEGSINGNIEELYYQHLHCLQFMQFTFATTGAGRSLYSNTQKIAKPLPSQIFRIAQELSTLSSSLPFSLSSTIFVRSDEEKINLMRALITGCVYNVVFVLTY
ncbi:uncharacterized protein [Antedon mediterranea]|uniref:uncharacterized protein n=1 Tax=Antedon mediterranea TaxID=105859 RepID=UPI003AF57E68